MRTESTEADLGSGSRRLSRAWLHTLRRKPFALRLFGDGEFSVCAVGTFSLCAPRAELRPRPQLRVLLSSERTLPCRHAADTIYICSAPIITARGAQTISALWSRGLRALPRSSRECNTWKNVGWAGRASPAVLVAEAYRIDGQWTEARDCVLGRLAPMLRWSDARADPAIAGVRVSCRRIDTGLHPERDERVPSCSQSAASIWASSGVRPLKLLGAGRCRIAARYPVGATTNTAVTTSDATGARVPTVIIVKEKQPDRHANADRINWVALAAPASSLGNCRASPRSCVARGA